MSRLRRLTVLPSGADRDSGHELGDDIGDRGGGLTAPPGETVWAELTARLGANPALGERVRLTPESLEPIEGVVDLRDRESRTAAWQSWLDRLTWGDKP